MKKNFLSLAFLAITSLSSLYANPEIFSSESKYINLNPECANTLLGLRTIVDNKDMPQAFNQLCYDLKTTMTVSYDTAFDGLKEGLNILEMNQVRFSPDAYKSGINAIQNSISDLVSSKACSSCGPCVPVNVCTPNICPPPCPPCNPCQPTCFTTGTFSTALVTGNPVNQSGLNFIVVKLPSTLAGAFNYQIIFITPFNSTIIPIVTATGPGNTSETVWLSGAPTNSTFTIADVLIGSTINFLVAPAT